MIVVIGTAALLTTATGAGRAVGIAAEIAAAAAADGAVVEIVTKVGEDGAGEELLLALGRACVGHLAVLRDPAQPTPLATDPGEETDDEVVAALLGDAGGLGADPGHEAPRAPAAPRSGLAFEPADVALALRYLRDYRVVVAVEPLPDGAADVVAEAAAYSDAGLVAIVLPGIATAPAYAAATIIEAPADDPDGDFAGLVGRYVAALDRGTAPAEAFLSATAAGGWETAEA